MAGRERVGLRRGAADVERGGPLLPGPLGDDGPIDRRRDDKAPVVDVVLELFVVRAGPRDLRPGAAALSTSMAALPSCQGDSLMPM